jgi:hypothetical protein
VFTHALSHDLETYKAALKRHTDDALLTQKAAFDLQLASFQSGLNDRLAREARVRIELERWANPILDAVRSLHRRLDNILNEDGYVALTPDARWNPEWSVTHAYFLPSTVYLFAQYFCWERLLQESLRFDLFRGQADKDTFLKALREVGRPLGRFPLDDLQDLPLGDCQVFSLQQRAAGEALIVEKDTGPVCMRIADFIAKWPDPAFAAPFVPITIFLDRLAPNTKRWRRLTLVHSALEPLDQQCQNVLAPPASSLAVV